jgi:hypothetical protein
MSAGPCCRGYAFAPPGGKAAQPPLLPACVSTRTPPASGPARRGLPSLATAEAADLLVPVHTLTNPQPAPDEHAPLRARCGGAVISCGSKGRARPRVRARLAMPRPSRSWTEASSVILRRARQQFNHRSTGNLSCRANREGASATAVTHNSVLSSGAGCFEDCRACRRDDGCGVCVLTFKL